MRSSSKRRGVIKTAVPVIVALLMVTTPLAGSASRMPGWMEPLSWVQTDKLTAGNADEPGLFDRPSHSFANFGFSMDTDGERLIVSAPNVNAAYIFDLVDDRWEQTGMIQEDTRLFHTTSAIDDIAIHGDLAVLGAAKESSEGMKYHGAAYVYEETAPGEWEQVARFEERPEKSGKFGWGVAVWEDTVVVGAPSMDPEGVFIYERDDQGWNLVKEFQPGTEYAYTGHTVDIVGDTILVADTLGDSREVQAGSVYVLERIQGEWTQTVNIIPPEPIDTFGFDLDFDGTNAIIGAAYSDRVMGHRVHDTAALGKAFIYERTADGWRLTADLDNPVPIPREPVTYSFGGELFGTSVAINGDVAAVGAHLATPRYAGAAYVYERVPDAAVRLDDGAWERSERLVYNETYPDDEWGMSAAVVGERVLIGAPFDNNRRDGTPSPANSVHIPCCAALLTEGRSAGSVYEFQPNPSTHDLWPPFET